MSTEKTSLRRYIEELSSKNTDYKFPEQAINHAESLKSLSSDLYTDNIRFIYELIQNADDAEAKNVILAIIDNNYLMIAHNGKVFDEKDIQGLCDVNNGTKKKDSDKTGYKDLGFKAVFGKSDKNKQWGNEDQQKWEKENDRQFIYPWQINPVWTNENEIPNCIKDILSSYKKQIHVANFILLNHVEEIHLAIEQLKQQLYMFLFLRNISEMKFFIKSTDTILIARDLNYGLKRVYFNQKIVSSWLIKRFQLNVPNDVQEKLNKDSKISEKLRFIKNAEMFFAAKYRDSITDQDGIVINPGGIEKLRDQDSILFSYLPTKIFEYKFPVLINANFLTNANREQIHTDSFWNQWLFDTIGSEIFQWIKELVIDDKFQFQAYRLIPLKLNLTNNILSKQFNESFEMAITQCNFILNRNNQLLKIDEVIMDSTSMSKQTSFISIYSMRQYIIDHYKDSVFKCADQSFIDYNSNLHRVGVRQFTWHNCIEMFKSDIFLKTHSIEQNKRMIEYFYSKCSKLGVASELAIHIEQIPFLMNQNNRLRLCKDIFFPAETIGDNTTIDSNDLFVNKIIFDWLNEIAPEEIKEWLQKLGVIERTDLTYLYKTIIPNASIYITKQNAIKTIEMLFRLFEKNAISKKDLDQLKKLKLMTTRQTLIPAEQCFFF
ncbi:unnamed protein product [Rotaria sp. Silwood2]|nr:unnamed protein product [Rotaria sp. Silwood2]